MRKKLTRAILGPLLWLALLAFVPAEKFYTYVNDEGFMVFTNFPPALKNLKNVTEHEIRRERPDLRQFDEARFNRYDDLILKYSDENGLDFNLVKAVILVESNFNPKARSPKGAMGLMQMIPGTARRYGVSDPYDPEESIRGGTKYLRYLHDMFDGDLKLVLSSYNAGENRVKKIMRVPDIAETQNYVKKIGEIYGNLDEKSQLASGAKKETLQVSNRIYVYEDPDGVITLTNMDPPRGATVIKQ